MPGGLQGVVTGAVRLALDSAEERFLDVLAPAPRRNEREGTTEHPAPAGD